MKITLPDHASEKTPQFSRLTVGDTMRRQVIALQGSDTVSRAIRTFIKYKQDAVVVCDKKNYPVGVVTQTQIMGTYYAGMPQDTSLADIMDSPVISCPTESPLESALLTMQESAIHRIYVTDRVGKAVGVLSYPDVVGALYRFCHSCRYGLRRKTAKGEDIKTKYSVQEVMTTHVVTAGTKDTIFTVIERLASYRLGALLIVDDDNSPRGVISKSNLALAFCRNVPLDSQAEIIMHSPVRACSGVISLEEGIRQMVFSEIGRLFVHDEKSRSIIGVLSLSDAARIRSGSCQACSSSRIKVKEGA